jgi:hypothetical protein
MVKNVVGNKTVGGPENPTRPKSSKEQKLEQGLEESMAGSDPVSVTQPSKSGADN